MPIVVMAFFIKNKITMKIKMLKQMSGATMWNAGQIYEVSEAKGQRLISHKLAIEIKDEKKISNNKSTGSRTNNKSRGKGTLKK